MIVRSFSSLKIFSTRATARPVAPRIVSNFVRALRTSFWMSEKTSWAVSSSPPRTLFIREATPCASLITSWKLAASWPRRTEPGLNSGASGEPSVIERYIDPVTPTDVTNTLESRRIGVPVLTEMTASAIRAFRTDMPTFSTRPTLSPPRRTMLPFSRPATVLNNTL